MNGDLKLSNFDPFQKMELPEQDIINLYAKTLDCDLTIAQIAIEALKERKMNDQAILENLDFIKKNEKTFLAEVNEKNEPVILTTKDERADGLKALTRKIEITANGIFLIFSKKVKSDVLVGEGKSKIVTESLNLKTGQITAHTSQQIQEDKTDEKDVLNELKINETIGIHKNIATMLPESAKIRFSKKRNCKKGTFLMPYFNGGTLATAEEKNTLSPQDKKLIVDGIFQGIIYLHALNIIWRDAKPQNIFLEKNQDKIINAAISDFGLSCFIDDDEQKKYSVGSDDYMAPELYKAIYENQNDQETYYKASIEANTSAIDSWSLGVLFYELYKGKKPKWTKGTPKRIAKNLAAYTRDNDPEIKKLKDSQDPMDRVLYQLFDPDPKNRLTVGDAYQNLKKENYFLSS